MNDNSAQPSQEEPASNEPLPAESQMVTVSENEMQKLKQEAAENKDKYLRLLAESENMRKRLNKERQEMMAFAKEQLIAEFLAPIDHMENALKYAEQMSEEVKHWSLGFQMILTQFKDVLANHGIQPFTSIGMVFNPHLHEAVETEERDDMPAGKVVEEFIRGYKMGDKTIRPARVKVSKAPQKSE